MNSTSKIFEDHEAGLEVKALFDNIKNDLQAPFVPNFFTVWGDAPEALKGIFPAMKHILVSGHLNRQLKEMIILAISSKNDCEYCVAAHQAFASMMGVSMEDIQSLKSQYTTSQNDPKMTAAINYALKLAKDANSGTLEDINQLKSVGYSKVEILEIIAMSGMSVFYNHLANATQINIDQAFMA